MLPLASLQDEIEASFLKIALRDCKQNEAENTSFAFSCGIPERLRNDLKRAKARMRKACDNSGIKHL